MRLYKLGIVPALGSMVRQFWQRPVSGMSRLRRLSLVFVWFCVSGVLLVVVVVAFGSVLTIVVLMVDMWAVVVAPVPQRPSWCVLWRVVPDVVRR